MIQVEDKIISMSIFKKYFVCDLNACKGACCVEGDAGAPLTVKEEKKLNNIYEKVKPYMKEEGISEIEKYGFAVYDSEGELTTRLVNNRECVFAIEKEGISLCSIEKAYLDGAINFKKPISCHLFPIRVKEYRDFDAINYEEIKICNPACECGGKLEVPVYAFLKEALIRKYGEDWYQKLLEAAKLLGK